MAPYYSPNGLSRRHFLSVLGVGCAFTACTPTTQRAFRMQSPWVNDAEFIGYFVALDKGFFKQNGLDLAYQPGGPDIIAEGTLISGRADLALTPIETTINLITRDRAPLKII